MHVDLQLVDSDSSAVSEERQVDTNDASHAYLGTDMTLANYGAATVDDLEFWFGERSKLIELDFLSRGKVYTLYNYWCNFDAIVLLYRTP